MHLLQTEPFLSLILVTLTAKPCVLNRFHKNMSHRHTHSPPQSHTVRVIPQTFLYGKHLQSLTVDEQNLCN